MINKIRVSNGSDDSWQDHHKALQKLFLMEKTKIRKFFLIAWFFPSYHLLILCWLQEYEREMRSYEIPVREFNIEDPPDYGDVFKPTEVPVLPKKVKSSEKEALKSFEQLDDLDDDVEMVTKEDPMLSAFASSNKTKVKRTLSTESLDSELGSPGQYQKSKKGPKTEKKNIRKIKRRVSSAAPVLELHNSPRIPVVSRPVYSQVSLVHSWSESEILLT